MRFWARCAGTASRRMRSRFTKPILPSWANVGTASAISGNNASQRNFIKVMSDFLWFVRRSERLSEHELELLRVVPILVVERHGQDELQWAEWRIPGHKAARRIPQLQVAQGIARAGIPNLACVEEHAHAHRTVLLHAGHGEQQLGITDGLARATQHAVAVARAQRPLLET